ncbi:MAG: hypothetical protein EBS50_11495 [Sphingomonadaceae bacterium]|nr:hypothetical protein [Sphingomonadaceae bacterium]
MHTFPALPKTKEGAQRQIDAILRSYARDYSGGGLFGFDMPTMRVNSPEKFKRYQVLHTLYITLPSRKKVKAA